MSDFPDRLRTAGTLYSAALEDGQKHEELLYLASYHIEQLEAERQWISVKDRLPETDGGYYLLVMCEDGGRWIEESSFDIDYDIGVGAFDTPYLHTHWMKCMALPPEEKA